VSKKNIRVMTGNDAVAEGAIAAGMRFFAGYPITPATEIAEAAARLLPKVGGKFIQMEDEIGSMGAIVGASFAGAKSMTATSGPGISLMQENLGFACIAEAPCVVVDVMRVGPSSGIATHPSQGDVMQARWGTQGDHPIIALVPSTVRECYDLTVRAFNLAEKYRTPVYLLSDAVIGHMSEKIEIPEEIEIIDRKKPTVPVDQYNPFEDDGTGIPPMATYGDGYLWYVSGIIHDKTGFPATANPDIATKLIDRLHDKIDNNLDDIIQYEEYMTDDAEIVIFAYGSVARSAISAIKTARQEGIKVGLIRPITIWPFPEEPIKKLRQQAKAFIVPEMNYGQVYYKVKEIVEGSAPVKLISQYNSKLITPQQILSVLREER
jgi:2-oxoglutarate ferredoxin oxidoreductase subunit alpha